MSSQSNETVFVGNKPVMNYVLACLTLFQNGSEGVILKARGRAITRAVDAAQIIANRYIPEVAVKSIRIDTEELRNMESGGTTGVSSMEIHLSKKERTETELGGATSSPVKARRPPALPPNARTLR
jgi:archaea-specific DNA-binding protein